MSVKYKAWLSVFALGLLFWLVVCASVAYAKPVKVVRSMTCHTRITPSNKFERYTLKVSERSDGSIMVNAPFINLEIDQWATNNDSEWFSEGETSDGQYFWLRVSAYETSGDVKPTSYEVHFIFTYDHNKAVTMTDCKIHGVWKK